MIRPKQWLAWTLCLAFPALAAPAPPPDDPGPSPDPTSRYERREVEGWTVLVNSTFLAEQPKLAEQTLAHLRHQLYQVTCKVPVASLSKLRRIRIWVEEKEPHHPCMAYHPDPGWLRDHGMNPDKARSVEVANARAFLDWTREQPWMVLHELAHGFHHQFLESGFENADVKSAYEAAMKSGAYKSVLRIDGRDAPAYAAENPMEYFAEASEAFFGTNDFYPFVRPELRRHDRRLFDHLVRLWEQP
jgi:hypothetical protein